MASSVVVDDALRRKSESMDDEEVQVAMARDSELCSSRGSFVFFPTTDSNPRTNSGSGLRSSSSSIRSLSFPNRLAAGSCRSYSRRSRPSASTSHSNMQEEHEADEHGSSWSLIHTIKSLLTQKRRLSGHGASPAQASLGSEQQQHLQENELATASPYTSSDTHGDHPQRRNPDMATVDGSPYPTCKNGTTRLVQRWSRIVRPGAGHGRNATVDGCKKATTKMQQRRSSTRASLRESMVTGTLYGRRKGRITLVIQEGPRARQTMAVFELPMLTNALLKEMATGLVKIALECRLSRFSESHPSTTTIQQVQFKHTPRNGLQEFADADNDADNSDNAEEGRADQDGSVHRPRHISSGAPLLWRSQHKKKQQQQEAELFRESSWTMYCNGRKTGFAMRRTCSASDLYILCLLRGVSMGAGILPAAAAAAAATSSSFSSSSSSSSAAAAMDSSTNSSFSYSSPSSLSSSFSASSSSSFSVSSSSSFSISSSSSTSIPVSAASSSSSIYCICTAINPSSTKCTCFVNPLLKSTGVMNTSAKQALTRTCDAVERNAQATPPFFELASSSGHYRMMLMDSEGTSKTTTSSSTMETASASAQAQWQEAADEQEHILYMRSSFQRVVGSRDSQAFYMVNPDQAFTSGPDLSIFFLRRPSP